MKYTYIASDNTATNGVQLGDTGDRDVVVYGVLFGVPQTSKTVWIYDTQNAVYNATTNIAMRLDTPASLISGQLPFVIDTCVRSLGEEGAEAGIQTGVRLGQKGTVITNGSQVTVLWDYAA